MKRIISIILATVAISVIAGAKQKEIKVLYWNIQNGMWADQGNNYDNFVNFVKSEDPDICVWAEAESRYRTGTADRMAGCEEAYLPYNWDILAQRYGHKYWILAGKRDTFPQVVTSKYPLEIVKRISGNGEDIIVVHGAGWVKVDIPGGNDLNIVTLHTWPQGYAYQAPDIEKSKAEQGGDVFRSVEMKYICEQTILSEDKDGKQMWMMLGDFNAISSIDNYHYNLDPKNKTFLLHDYVRANTPYIDLIEKMYPNDFQHTTLSGRRIDFVYVTDPLFKRITNAEVIREGYPKNTRAKGLSNFCYPSDHYPIVVKIRK